MSTLDQAVTSGPQEEFVDLSTTRLPAASVPSPQAPSRQNGLSLFGTQFASETSEGLMWSLAQDDVPGVLMALSNRLSSQPASPASAELISFMDNYLNLLCFYGRLAGANAADEFGFGLGVDTAKVTEILKLLGELESAGQVETAALLEQIKPLAGESLYSRTTIPMGDNTLQARYFPITQQVSAVLTHDSGLLDCALEYESSDDIRVSNFRLGSEDNVELRLTSKLGPGSGQPSDGIVDWNVFDAELRVRTGPQPDDMMSFRYNPLTHSFLARLPFENEHVTAELVLGDVQAFAEGGGEVEQSPHLKMRFKDGPLAGTDFMIDTSTGDLQGTLRTTAGSARLTGEFTDGSLSHLTLDLGRGDRGKPAVHLQYSPSTHTFSGTYCGQQLEAELVTSRRDGEDGPETSVSVSANFPRSPFLQGMQFEYRSVEGPDGETEIRLCADTRIDGTPFKISLRKTDSSQADGLFEVEVLSGKSMRPVFSFIADGNGVRNLALYLANKRYTLMAGYNRETSSGGGAIPGTGIDSKGGGNISDALKSGLDQVNMNRLMGSSWPIGATVPSYSGETVPGFGDFSHAPGHSMPGFPVDSDPSSNAGYYMAFINHETGPGIKEVSFNIGPDGNVHSAQMTIQGRKATLRLGMVDGDLAASLTWGDVQLEYREGVGFVGRYTFRTEDGRGIEGTITVLDFDEERGIEVEFSAGDRRWTGNLSCINGETQFGLRYNDPVMAFEMARNEDGGFEGRLNLRALF